MMKKGMRRRFWRKAGHVFFSVTLGASLAATGLPVDWGGVQAASGNTYYVDGEAGNDANPGTESSPFQTIQKAVDTMEPGDTCLIREGIYPEEVIVSKSGTESAPITLKNYPGETVTVSGCDPLTDWEADENRPGEGIYKTEMDWSLGENGDRNQLFADGELMYEARYPNVEEGSTLTNFNYATAGSGTGFVSGTDKEKSQLVDEAFKEWAQTEDFFDGAKIWMVPGSQWTALTSYVESYDPETGTVVFPSTFRGKNNAGGYYNPKSGSPYYIFGTYTLLDAEMEWWYDDENQEIYVKMPGGQDPDDAGIYVEAKKRETAFDLSGASYVNIEGIQMRGSTIITDESSSHILLQDMKGEYVGHCSSIGFESLTDNASPQDDLGVLIKGTFIEVNSCEFSNSSGPVINIQGSDNKLINCYIHDGNYIGTYAGHAKISGRRQFISNNTICESGRDVLSFRNLSESVIQYNDIYGAGRLTLDVGVMYSAETDGQNTLIHHNYIHDNYTKSNNVGLYPDEMTHNFIIYENVVYNANTAYQFNQPSLYNLVYNNTGYNTNKVADSYQQSFSDSRGRQYLNNLFNKSDSGSYSSSSTYAKANVNETTMFVDAEGLDFRLQDGSAAIGAGVPVSGVTPEGEAHPAAGAYQPGDELFQVGHDFENPPEILDAPDLSEFEYRNRVKNGGFEYGTLESWDGSAQVVLDSAWHSSSKTAATCFYGAVLESGDAISQTVEVEPYTTYTIGLITRAPETEGNIAIRVSADGEAELTEAVSTGNWNANKRKFLTFTTGNTTEATLTIANTGTAAFYLDDVGVQKEISMIGELSSPITLKGTDEGCAVQFEELEEGHAYYYSDSREKDESLQAGDFQTEKPEEYSHELKNGMILPWRAGEYLNVVETMDGKVVGAGSVRYLGKTETIQREAINDGMIRGGSYKDTVLNEMVEDGVLGDDDTLYMINLNSSSTADYVRRGYMQFDLSDLDPERIAGATLQFYIYQTNPDESAEVGQ